MEEEQTWKTSLVEGKKMNKRQEIFLEGVEEKLYELHSEFYDIPRDHGDEENLLCDAVSLQIREMRLVFKRYILEVVK